MSTSNPESASERTTDVVLVARRVSKTFPPIRKHAPATLVLHDVSLTVPRAEFLAIVGPSGSGKSTLLYCLSGLEPLSSGSVHILGYDLGGMSRSSRAALRRDHIGFIFQNFNLIDSLSATENVELPARLAKKRIDRQAAAAVLDHVGLHARGAYRPNKLSGGEQQRVAIARVLAARPTLVFADEPTGSLDLATGHVIVDMLLEAVTGGRTVGLPHNGFCRHSTIEPKGPAAAIAASLPRHQWSHGQDGR